MQEFFECTCVYANIITNKLRIRFAWLAGEKHNRRMKIGEAIRKLRLELGATQEAVALEAGTNAGNLSRIERCQQRPSLDLVEQIAAALGTTVADLYAYVEANQPKAAKIKPKTINRGKSDDASTAILFRRSFHELTPENKQLAVEFVKLLIRTQRGK